MSDAVNDFAKLENKQIRGAYNRKKELRRKYDLCVERLCCMAMDDSKEGQLFLP